MDRFMSLAQTMSTNRYLCAIRDGFIIALPLTLAAAFAILINNVVLATNLPYALANPEYYSPQFIEVINVFKFIFASVEFGGLQWITPIVLMGIAFSLSDMSRAEKPFVNALIVFGAFLTLLPKGDLAVGGYWQHQWVDGYTDAIASGAPALTLSALFSSANLFTALAVGIIFTELLLKLQELKQLEIVLPDQVPPMVAKSFSTLIPAFLTLTIAGVLAALFMFFKPLGFGDISSFISGLVQEPFLAIARTGVGGVMLMVIYVFFANFLWIFGLHGPNILAGFSGPTLTALSLNNQTLYAQTGNAYAPELATFTMGFVDAYTQYGGSGATLGLLIAIYIVSKRADYKAISKLAIAPGIFEINEPLVFGLPIVLNPILGIPFVLAPLVSIILPAILTTMGWLPKVVVAIPWVVPPVLNSFLATGASWRAAFVGLVNIVLITLIYLPFVLVTNSAMETSEMDEMVEEPGRLKKAFAKVSKKSTLGMKSKAKADAKKAPAKKAPALSAAKKVAPKAPAKPAAKSAAKPALKASAKPKPKAKPTTKKAPSKTTSKATTKSN